MSFSYMWSFSEFFRPFRNFLSKIPYIKKPLLCPECFSFWVGVLVSFLYNPIVIYYNILLPNIICGLVTHMFACLIYKKKTSSLNIIN